MVDCGARPQVHRLGIGAGQNDGSQAKSRRYHRGARHVWCMRDGRMPRAVSSNETSPQVRFGSESSELVALAQSQFLKPWTCVQVWSVSVLHVSPLGHTSNSIKSSAPPSTYIDLTRLLVSLSRTRTLSYSAISRRSR